ncbi:MAG: hypothetical protein ACK2UK_13895 [Candidatus Promineifilaceae bacterium]
MILAPGDLHRFLMASLPAASISDRALAGTRGALDPNIRQHLPAGACAAG